jgi:hypothetical protein
MCYNESRALKWSPSGLPRPKIGTGLQYLKDCPPRHHGQPYLTYGYTQRQTAIGRVRLRLQGRSSNAARVFSPGLLINLIRCMRLLKALGLHRSARREARLASSAQCRRVAMVLQSALNWGCGLKCFVFGELASYINKPGRMFSQELKFLRYLASLVLWINSRLANIAPYT